MENLKEINDDNKLKIDEIINNTNNKGSFEKLCQIQKLIKKDSALKELCKLKFNL